MTLRTVLKRRTLIEAEIAMEVDFDPRTGKAEIVSDGRVVSYAETHEKRDLQHEIFPEDLDRETFASLINQGAIAKPKPGDTFQLSGEEWSLPADLEPELLSQALEPALISTDDILDGMVRKNDPVQPHRRLQMKPRLR